jgi:hypothetical protein
MLLIVMMLFLQKKYDQILEINRIEKFWSTMI